MSHDDHCAVNTILMEPAPGKEPLVVAFAHALLRLSYWILIVSGVLITVRGCVWVLMRMFR